MRLSRRHLQIALGAVWLLDGALQLQPFMFSVEFAHQVISAAALGQPGFVSVPVRLSAGLIESHHVMADAAFAGVQLLLAVGLFFRPTVKAALAGSVAWALGVWYVGEGLAGLASGHTSMLLGAPGAAFLYVLIALAAWPARAPAARPTKASSPFGGLFGALLPGRSDLPPRSFAVAAWAVTWATGALYQLLPGQSGGRGLEGTLESAARGAPGWIASADHVLAHLTEGRSWIGLVLALVELFVAFAVLKPNRWRATGAAVGISLALFEWVLGQAMGQLYTGQATDPNAGLLVVLLGLAVMSTCAARASRRSVAKGSVRSAVERDLSRAA